MASAKRNHELLLIMERLESLLAGWPGAVCQAAFALSRGNGREEALALQRFEGDQSLFAQVFRFRRDFCAGGLMILFGLVAAVNGPNYRVGTLGHMGPGFMPTALGVVLVLLGILIAGTASVGSSVEEAGSENLLPEHPQWFAWLCILAGPALFIVFGSIGAVHRVRQHRGHGARHLRMRVRVRAR
jgi:hypothetical protein